MKTQGAKDKKKGKGASSQPAKKTQASKDTKPAWMDEPEHPEPPHSFKWHIKKKMLTCRVTLHKIPHNCINFEPTDTQMYLDTLKYTKKWVLNVPYPNGLEVDAKQADARLEYGILIADIPMTKLPDFQPKSKAVDPTKPAWLKEAEEEQENAATEEKEEEQEEQVAPTKPIQKQKGKMTKGQAAGTDKVLEKGVQKRKSPKAKGKEGKKQEKQQEKQQVLSLLEEVSSAEEKRRSGILEKEQARDTAMAAKEEKRSMKAQKKQAGKDRVKKAVQEKLQSKAQHMAEKAAAKKAKRAAPTPSDADEPPKKKKRVTFSV